MGKEQRIANLTQLLIGITVLLLGSLVYLLDRSARWVPFLPDYFSAIPRLPPYVSGLGLVFPTFAHTLGFSLITAAILMPQRMTASLAVLFWATINIVFELGQHPKVASWIAQSMSGQVQENVFTDTLLCYFRSGTFDVYDLAAILLAASSALVIVWLSSER